jgi:hypothetical protein
VRFLLTWRTATAGVGLGHAYTVTNRKGEKVDKIARPQVRRLWYGPGGLFRVNVLPVAGHAVELENHLDDLTSALGMSRGVIAERRPGLRSMRYVLEFRRAARIDVHAVELPRPRREQVDGGANMSDLPAPLRAVAMPETVAAVGRKIDPETGLIIGSLFERRMSDRNVADQPYEDWAPVEVEYRPDIASRAALGGKINYRRTRGFEGVPLQCRPGFTDHPSRDGVDLYGDIGCEAYPRLDLDEQQSIRKSDSATLPCSECRHGARQQIAAEPVGAPLAVVTDSTDWREFLSAVLIGIRADGGRWTIPLYDRQGVLVAGKSGGGKSGVIWALNIGLVPALIAGVVELRGVDPKSIELHRGLQFFAEYADEPEAMIELLETAVRDMNERKAILRDSGEGMFMPSAESPLVIVEIDELLMLTPKLMADPKLGKRAQAAIITLLTQGRAFGFLLIGGIQDPRKESLDQRDLFQISIALRLDNDMAELVLSKAAVRNGANTEGIPLGSAGAGVGYVMDVESTGDEPIQVRAFWADRNAVKAWEAYLVDARASDESERYEAAQKAVEQMQAGNQEDGPPEPDGGGEVIPLTDPQAA